MRHQVNRLTLPAASEVVGKADPGREVRRGSGNEELTPLKCALGEGAGGGACSCLLPQCKYAHKYRGIQQLLIAESIRIRKDKIIKNLFAQKKNHSPVNETFL